MGLQYGCFLPVFAEEYSGFPVGDGDGFLAEWPEGLFSYGEEYRYFIREKQCNIAGLESLLYIKE